MRCSAYFGELSEERKKCWNCDDKNPYNVLLQDKVYLEHKGHDLLDAGKRFFREEIKLDWGSFAWKCTFDEIYKFLNEYQSTLPWLAKNEEKLLEDIRAYVEKRKNVEFGIVFVEEC